MSSVPLHDLSLPDQTRSSFLSRLRRKDEAGWKQFYDTYWRLLYATALDSGLSDNDAQDVVQQTLIGVVSSIPGFVHRQGGARFKTWLGTIVRNKINDHFRRRKRQREVNFSDLEAGGEAGTTVVEQLVAEAPGASDWEAEWNRRWDENMVCAALDWLRLEANPQHFEVFRRSVVCGHKTKEIANDLNLSQATVYSVIFRLRVRLKGFRGKLEKEPLDGIDPSDEDSSHDQV